MAVLSARTATAQQGSDEQTYILQALQNQRNVLADGLVAAQARGAILDKQLKEAHDNYDHLQAYWKAWCGNTPGCDVSGSK